MTAEFEVLRSVHMVADLDEIEANEAPSAEMRSAFGGKLQPTKLWRPESPWKTVMRGLLLGDHG